MAAPALPRTSSPSPTERATSIDLDVSSAAGQARVRLFGRGIYMAHVLAALFLVLVFAVLHGLLAYPRPLSQEVNAVVTLALAAVLGCLFLVAALEASVPKLHLTLRSRKAYRRTVQRIEGDAQGLTLTLGNGTKEVFSFRDPTLGIELYCPEALLGTGARASRFSPFLDVKLLGKKTARAVLTLEAFHALRTFLLLTGTETFEDERALITSTLKLRGRSVTNATPTHMLRVGSGVPKARADAGLRNLQAWPPP